MINTKELLNELNNQLNACNSEQKIVETKNIFIKQHLSPLYLELKKASNKKELGELINNFKNEIEEKTTFYISQIRNKNDELKSSIDITADIETFKLGRKHLINSTIELIANFFKNYNFEFIKGDEITTTEYNFDNLNIGKDHVARDLHDTLFINDNLLLRTHCTSSTSLVLQKKFQEKDIRVFSYGNVYRKDEDDATHSHQFTQIDIVWLRKDFSLSNLKFIINKLINYLFGNHLKIRYRLSYFPFTEPSFEVDVECSNCLGSGCHICKKTGWIEILGAGMLNQEVIKCAGIKDIDSGLAAGIGVERIAMLKYNIKDIRDLYSNDFNINKQFKS